MLGRTIVAAVLAALALTGCTVTVQTASTPSRAELLWKQRTEHVGDNSHVIGLTREAGFGPAGTYTISLRTAARPYAVTITLEDVPDKPFDATSFTAPSTLLLGTIADLDVVHVRSAGQSYSLTAARATEQLGYDVKTLGRDEQRLTAYVDTLDD